VVVVAVHHQRGHVERREVAAEVGHGECLDALGSVAVPRLHALEPEGIADALGHLDAVAVVTEGRAIGQVLVGLGPVGDRAGTDLVEHFDRDPTGLSGRCTINGGTADTSATLATRSLP
jgi:hypothetical protein